MFGFIWGLALGSSMAGSTEPTTRRPQTKVEEKQEEARFAGLLGFLKVMFILTGFGMLLSFALLVFFPTDYENVPSCADASILKLQFTCTASQREAPHTEW